MAVYYIGSYDITDPIQFRKYPPLVAALLPRYGGRVLALDTAAYAIEGNARTMNTIIQFPSRDAALGLYNDPDYQEAKRIRESATANRTRVIFHRRIRTISSISVRRTPQSIAISIFAADAEVIGVSEQ